MTTYTKMLKNEIAKRYEPSANSRIYRSKMATARKYINNKMSGDESEFYSESISFITALAICAVLRQREPNLTINRRIGRDVTRQLQNHGLIDYYPMDNQIAFFYPL